VKSADALSKECRTTIRLSSENIQIFSKSDNLTQILAAAMTLPPTTQNGITKTLPSFIVSLQSSCFVVPPLP
jgi:hypothetical protein